MASRPVTADAPEFRWTAVPDAAGYRLQLAASADFEECYYDERVDGPTTVPLADVLPVEADTVVWRVRAGTGSEAPWCGPASFTVAPPDDREKDAQFLVDAPPVPIRPIQGDAVDAEAATFTWEGVPEASGYHVQVGPSPDVGDPIVDLTLDQTTSLTLFGELPREREGLYWRVRALFPNNTAGPWSRASGFGTDPDVEPDVPVGGEHQVPNDETDPPDEPAPSVKRSAVAAGPAREARTSGSMAIVAISLLVVSFVLTILLIMVSV